MRAVKSKDSKMEQVIRQELQSKGLEYQTNVKELAGKPDIVFENKKVAVFLDSCFWHGCKDHCRLPQTNRDYWEAKIAKNIERDARINRLYEERGWKVLRFWEHDLKANLSSIISKIEEAAQNGHC